MKKLLSLSASKMYLVCGLGLLMTIGAFWHHQVNQAQLDQMTVLNQGVGTCFNRVSQTFTAMMIKDIQSPYLNRGFMGLSDECLNETIKGINPFRKNVGKGYETLNQLISEVHWFHEKVLKIHSPMLAGRGLDTPLEPLSTRFSKMENFKVSLIDEIDANTARLREVQMNDEILMGAGLIAFVIALSILSLQEFNRFEIKRDIERQALNLLKAGQANVGAMVDQIVDRALSTQGMPVTAQIFKDYHGELLERMALKTVKAEVKNEEVSAPVQNEEAPMVSASLKEALVSIQNTQPKDSIHMSEVRDVSLSVAYENLEQMLNSAVTQLVSRRADNKRVMISNQIHSDRSVINLVLAGNVFTASELEFAGSEKGVGENIDMNLVILKEMVSESGAQWHLENKTDRQGQITGMNIRLTLARASRNTKNLVSVMKGKKKDLTRELMN
jgi:hypothetical protein